MRNKMLPALAVLAALLTLSASRSVAADGFYDLYRMTAANDPAIKRAEAQLSSVRADAVILDTRYYPRVNGNMSLNKLSQSQDTDLTSEVSSTVNNFTYGVNGYVPLYDKRTGNAREALEYDFRSGEAQLASIRNDLIGRYADAYFALLKAGEDLRIAKEEAVRIRAVYDQANAFLSAGTGDIISVHEAKARYDGVAADLNRFENQLTLAQQRLSLLVGRPVEEVTDYFPESISGPDPDDLDWWVEKLEERDPMLRAVRERLAKTGFETEAAYSEHYPVFQAFAGYNVSHGSPYSPSLESRQWNMGVGMTVPLYTGGEIDAKIARGVTAQSEQRYYLQELRRGRIEYLKQLFYDLKYGSALVYSLRLKKESVELQLAAVKKGREIGTRTAIDLLNAEEARSVAQRDYKKAIYDSVVKSVQLKCLVGLVDENRLLPGLAAPETKTGDK